MGPKNKHSISNIAKGLVVIVLFLIIWEVAAIIINNNYILPRLGDILLVLVHPLTSVLGGSSLVENAARKPSGSAYRVPVCSSGRSPPRAPDRDFEGDRLPTLTTLSR